MYDRVAGDDFDTGDEIDAFESSTQETIIHIERSQNNSSYNESGDDMRDVLPSSKGPRKSNTNIENGVDSPAQVLSPRRIAISSPTDADEDKVVMRITPRPPVRKRPKSTPVLDHVSSQLSQMMEDKIR